MLGESVWKLSLSSNWKYRPQLCLVNTSHDLFMKTCIKVWKHQLQKLRLLYTKKFNKGSLATYTYLTIGVFCLLEGLGNANFYLDCQVLKNINHKIIIAQLCWFKIIKLLKVFLTSVIMVTIIKKAWEGLTSFAHSMTVYHVLYRARLLSYTNVIALLR